MPSAVKSSRTTISFDAAAQSTLETRQSEAVLFDLAERIEKVFATMLARSVGRATMEHLRVKRGFDDATIQRGGFGYLPEERGWLLRWAQHAKVSVESLAELGLLKRSDYFANKRFQEQMGRAAQSSDELGSWFLEHLAETPEAYTDYPVLTRDGPNGRMQYLAGNFMAMPIRIKASDGQVRTAGFQFRSMRPDAEKGERYRSPLNTRLLVWNQTVIGLAEAEANILKSGAAVLCEGRFDECAVSAAVADLPEENRPGGVSLGGISVRGATGEAGGAGVLALIPAKEVTLFLDSDGPGSAGVLALGAALEGRGVRVYVARIQDVWKGDAAAIPKDVCELNAIVGGPQMVRDVLSMARQRPLEVYAPELLGRMLADEATGGQLWHRLRALDRLEPVLRSLRGKAQEAGIERVSETLDFPPEVIRIAIGSSGVGVAGPVQHKNKRSLKG